MASFPKLVFHFALVLSVLCSGSAAPIRARPRRDVPTTTTPPIATPTPTPTSLVANMRAQQDSFDFDLADVLVLATSTIQPLEIVPANCAAYSLPQGECTTSFEAVNITYDDCSDAWTVCRCSTANMTMDTVVQRLGQVPVGLRRYIATVLVSPDLETHAYTLVSGDIHMFGDTEVDTWVHEVSRCDALRHTKRHLTR